jgi:anti-sigma28 factor (negative regulator of flagellin synthesis)
MRVEDRNLTGTSAAQAGKSAELQEVDRNAELKGTESRWTSRSDQVELSGLAGRLSRALSISAAERMSRVEELSAQYAEGRYEVDSFAVSRAILDEMRAVSGESAGRDQGPQPAG